MTKSPIIKNITDAFFILDLLNEYKEMGVSDITEKSKLPKTTVFRIIKSLESVNAIKQIHNQKYILDYQLVRYAKNAGENDNLSVLARPFMKKIKEQTGESVNLGVVYEEQIIIINTVVGEFYQLQTTLLPVSPLYCSGMGKLFLSHWSDKELQVYFKELKSRTSNTITSFHGFKNIQQKILNNDLAYDDEEYEYGLSCYAVPIYNSQSNVPICALSISGPTSRLKNKGIDKLIFALKEQAKLFQKIM